MTEPIRMDRKYRTRDGERARILCIDAGGLRPVVAVVYADHNDTPGRVFRFTELGQYGGSACGLDLIPVPEEVTLWVNVYGSAVESLFGQGYPTRADADEAAGTDRITCIETKPFKVPS